MLINYDDDDDNSQGYAQTKEAVRALTKDDILQPYISDDDFRSSNVRLDNVGYNYKFWIKDIRKILQHLNQLKKNLNFMGLFLLISMYMLYC